MKGIATNFVEVMEGNEEILEKYQTRAQLSWNEIRGDKDKKTNKKKTMNHISAKTMNQRANKATAETTDI